jgi:hypothetical protein
MEFPPVSASFRHAERRKPAAAVHVEMIDIVDESDALDCCRRFPPFPPFPPLVFASHPKRTLLLNRRHGACPLEQGADDRRVRRWWRRTSVVRGWASVDPLE